MWLTLVLHRLPPRRARFFRWTMAGAFENAFEVAADAGVGAERGGWGRRGCAHIILRRFHGGIPNCSPCFAVLLQILAVKSALCSALAPLRPVGRGKPKTGVGTHSPVRAGAQVLSASEMLVVHMRHVSGPRKRALWHIQLFLEAKVFAVNAVDVEGSSALMMAFGVIHWTRRSRQALRATMRSRLQPMAS